MNQPPFIMNGGFVINENFQSMNNYKISIVPLTNFIGASEAKKKTIIKEQKKANLFKAPLYRTAKATLPKFFYNGYDQSLIVDTITRLQGSDLSTDWRKNNVETSISALRHFMRMQFPSSISNLKCSFIPKISNKECDINGVTVRVAPDVVFKWSENGRKRIGGIKFHIGKTIPLDSQIGRLRSSLLSHYLQNTLAEKDEEVDNKFCFCIDVIYEQIFTAPYNITNDIVILNNACSEIKTLWNIA